jgi:hypothetical protein
MPGKVFCKIDGMDGDGKVKDSRTGWGFFLYNFNIV